MKAVMIIFNQTLRDRIEFIFDRLEIRGFTLWKEVQGRGSETGEPRMGTHTWPEQNSAALVVIADDMVDPLLDSVRKLDALNKEIGVRAFVWKIEQGY